MSQNLEENIIQTVRDAFTTVLEMDVHLNPAAMVVARGQPYICSTIQITGAWQGVVSLSAPLELGANIASIMFEEEIDISDTENLEDAMGEISNIISGSFKSSLVGTCHLGLPVITCGVDYRISFPGSHVECSVGFEVEDDCFHVTLIQSNRS